MDFEAKTRTDLIGQTGSITRIFLLWMQRNIQQAYLSEWLTAGVKSIGQALKI
ncbi:hypothetical protein [Bacillus sp. 1P06AnD]|uniref:hypothetical protein n=1 Tax=Bacillus sp. 1P06AnD TaxID=3132208 RepID=UPI0039A3AC36